MLLSVRYFWMFSYRPDLVLSLNRGGRYPCPKTLLITAQSFLKSKALMELARSRFNEFGITIKAAPIAINGRLDRSMLPELLEDCSYWIVGREAVDSLCFPGAKKLEIISKYGVGLDNVDVAACSAHGGVRLVHRPGVNAQAVAEHASALCLAYLVRFVRGRVIFLKDDG
jgi:phosphoglycerate dehydrogenase-like enzyme